MPLPRFFFRFDAFDIARGRCLLMLLRFFHFFAADIITISHAAAMLMLPPAVRYFMPVFCLMRAARLRCFDACQLCSCRVVRARCSACASASRVVSPITPTPSPPARGARARSILH